MTPSDSNTSAQRQPPVGIDLGTTYSLVAYLDASGRPTTVPNSWGDLLTPSALFCDDDAVVVGKEAVKNAVLAPDRYAECFKRDMGRGAFRHKIRDLSVPPEILSAFVLERLKKDAETRLGHIGKAVITVPAFFDETRRKATQDAGQIAGLEVLDIINEPTAAAVAYGYNCGLLGRDAPNAGKPKLILVYDLGGGTFDVTILKIEGNQFQALATDGDVLLGGKDFDQRLVDHIAGRFQAAHGVDPRSDPQDATQLWLDAQEAKHSLSDRTKTSISCFHAGIRMRVEITRDEFQEMTRDLLDRTETTAGLVVKQAGVDWSKIDRVLVVGGSSRMPTVRDMLRRLSGKEPDCSQSPDEAVAHGAAIYAGMLARQDAAPEKPTCRLINVSSHSLGVVGIHKQTKVKTNAVLIPKNSPLPCRAVRNFLTAQAGQRSICVSVVEGESYRPEECIALGECVVRDLPPGLPQGTPVEVEYSYAANGRIAVSARVPAVRHSAHVEIKRDGAGPLENLEVWRKKLLMQPSDGVEGVLPVGPPVDLSDGESVRKRLDGLYMQLGAAATGLKVPPAISRSQTAALQAISEHTQLKNRLQEAESARQAAGDRSEAIRLDAVVAQTKTKLREAQTRVDFARVVLGRECMGAGFWPARMENEIKEIERLQEHLSNKRGS